MEKPPSGLNRGVQRWEVSTSSLSPPASLKRKRPARLDILISSTGFGAGGSATPAVERRDMMEVDRDGYSVIARGGGEKLWRIDTRLSKIFKAIQNSLMSPLLYDAAVEHIRNPCQLSTQRKLVIS